MARSGYGWGRTVIVGSAVAIALSVAGSAGATIINYAATIDGAQETPPIVTPALATGTFVLDTVAHTLGINIVIVVPPPSGEVAAHIHGPGAPGVAAGIIFPLPLGSPKIATWNLSPTEEGWVTSELTYANIHSMTNLGGEIRGQIVRVPSCGDGFLDAGEQCDDGNNTNGDCCDSLCQFEAAATPCAGTGLCGPGQCDGEGECVAQPAVGCKTALKSILLIKNNNGNDAKDKMIFKWVKGAQTDLSELGMPTGTTAYALCLYAGTTSIAKADVPASATLWSTLGTSGFKYKDQTGSEDGITKILLKSGAANKSKVLVKGKGNDLPDPPAGPLTLPVTAQVVNSDGVCFEGVFNTPIQNNPALFKAKQ